MSTLVENVQKVKNAHAALKTAIASKGVDVPDGTKLTDMPALVEQISTEPVPTNPRAVFTFDTATSLVVPNTLVVDMASATNLGNCFANCEALTSLTLQDGFGSNATNLEYCFYYCTALTSLTLPDGFGQNAINLEYCFSNFSLTSLTLPDGFGQNATNIGGCFYYCTVLASLTLPDGFGSNATNLDNCFYKCSSLASLTLPVGFGQNATNLNNCFYNCSQLTNITGNPNFKVSLSLQNSPKLTHDSIMVVVNGLQTVTSKQTLKLGSTNLAKLTEADKKIATDKGWTLA